MELYQDEFDSNKSNNYTKLNRLGAGTYGDVYKGVDKISGNIIAIKYIRILSKSNGLPKSIFRELEVLKHLNNSNNVITLYDIYPTDCAICLVMEYCDYDLTQLINNNNCIRLSNSLTKLCYNMMFKAIAYCHSNNIIHRDIKPSNFLINSKGMIKLADFGLARIYNNNSNVSLSHQVATRQYRAPELLFASRHYNEASDIWSLAVVMIELIINNTLFQGNNDIDQMQKVFQVMGSPTPSVWPGVEELPDYSKVRFPDMKPLPLEIIVPQASSDEIEFIKHFLVLDPRHRASARQGLGMSYFFSHPLPSSTTTLSHYINNTASSKQSRKIETVEQFLCYY